MRPRQESVPPVRLLWLTELSDLQHLPDKFSADSNRYFALNEFNGQLWCARRSWLVARSPSPPGSPPRSTTTPAMATFLLTGFVALTTPARAYSVHPSLHEADTKA